MITFCFQTTGRVDDKFSPVLCDVRSEQRRNELTNRVITALDHLVSFVRATQAQRGIHNELEETVSESA